MTDDLKPCPFCGSIDVEAIMHERKAKEIEIMDFVVCHNCKAHGPTFVKSVPISVYEMMKLCDEAAAAWNHRVEPSAIAARHGCDGTA
jgi:Lar family restriction alleviation protein